jgi:hypothetical protein
MYTADIANCCGARVIYGFGNGENVSYRGGQPNTYKGHKKELIKKLQGLKASGINIAIAFTNDDQVSGEEALEDCGFKSTSHMKGNHHETKIKLWWKCGITRFKEADCKDRYAKPEEDEDR